MRRTLFHPIFLLLLGTSLLTSCASARKYQKAEALYFTGQYAQAAQRLDTEKVSVKTVLLHLYAGSSWLMAGNLGKALAAFRRAEHGMEMQDEKIFLGDSYLARTYDGIQMLTYQAIAMLALGKSENARVAFNRLEERLGRASRRSIRAIEKHQKEVMERCQEKSNAQASVAFSRAEGDSRNQAALTEYHHLLDTWGAYANYENPASRFLSGIYRLFYRQDGDASDAEKAVFQMKRTVGMTDSPVAKQGYHLAEAVANGHDGKGKSFTQANLNDCLAVIFENGLGAQKGEWRFDLLIPLERPLYVGIALPFLAKRQEAYPYLTFRDGEISLGRTEPLCDVDRIVATEFRQELPGIVAAAITETVIKVVLQVVITHEVAKEYGAGYGALAGVAASLLSAGTTYADVRHWNLLPKEYQGAFIHKPTSGKLSIDTPEGASLFEVTVPKEGPAILFVKIPSRRLPAICLLMGPRIHP